ncbi:MAG: N-6 DNA methylase [Lentisphaeria bacterium]|nr:N-6 DNA methylase [Lentisphaeria bacterium]
MLTDINKTIERIHNYIYANDGLDNYEVLDELLKVFYLKTYDEQHDNILLLANSEADLLEKVQMLFTCLTKNYPTLFSSDDKINLKTGTIVFIMKELFNISLSKLKSDVKGHLMQRIIDRSYREGKGQFFTPAQVVDVIVKMINPQKGQRGCDPACGTGGFMFAALENMAKNDNIVEQIKNVDFFDISKSVVKIISMRLMFEFAVDSPNIKIQDSISADIPAIYDFVLTNPPFGSQGRITDKTILGKYTLGHNENGITLSSQVPDILFIEKVLSILKDGGKGAIILPDGNFENPSSKYIRNYLIQNSKIDAIISLPEGTFIPYGTGVKSSILFFTKQTFQSYDYDVFFGKINQLGYTFSKHSKTLYDASGNVMEDYSRVINAYQNQVYDDENFVINISDIIANNMNLSHHYYSPKINKHINTLIGSSTIRLRDLVTVESKKQKIDPNDLYQYVEISDINSLGCEIINCSHMYGSELPSRASYKIKENQIVVAVAGNSIGSEWNAKAIVTQEFDGCICTNGLIVLNAINCSPFLLLHFFNTEAFRIQVKKYRFGTAIPTISREDFLDIIVPDYSNEKKEQIIANMKTVFKLKAEIKKLLTVE